MAARHWGLPGTDSVSANSLFSGWEPQVDRKPCTCSWLHTYLLGAIRVAHLVINIRNHLQRPAQRGQGLPAGKGDTSD